MQRWFHTAGPCKRECHYMLPAPDRLVEVPKLAAQLDCCVIYAPRQNAYHSGAALNRGLVQIDDYMAGLGLETRRLVIFDQRPDQPPIADRTRARQRRFHPLNAAYC